MKKSVPPCVVCSTLITTPGDLLVGFTYRAHTLYVGFNCRVVLSLLSDKTLEFVNSFAFFFFYDAIKEGSNVCVF